MRAEAMAFSLAVCKQLPQLSFLSMNAVKQCQKCNPNEYSEQGKD